MHDEALPAIAPPRVVKAGEPQGFLRMIGFAEAMAEGGELAETYRAMRSGASTSSRPSVYNTPGGDAANIVRCHSLDPEGMRAGFGISGPIHWSERSLPWRLRELINTVTSQANNCFY